LQLVDTEEHRDLRVSVRRFLAERSPIPEVHRRAESAAGHDRAVWRQMAVQLGLQGLAIPERFGGSGFSALERAIALQELGRALYDGPYLSTAVLAADLLLALADETACAEFLPGIADGSLLAAVAFAGDHRDAVTADRRGGTWIVRGRGPVVLDAMAADVLLVVAAIPDGLGVFAVDPAAPGVTRSPLPSLDLTRPVAELVLDSVPARRIADGDSQAPVSAALDQALAAIAAEQTGGAEACLDMAVEYAKIRVQFGQPIGGFQAVKHKCADLLMHVEFARAASAYASWTLVEDPADSSLATALAKAYCSDVFVRTAVENIQIHGGIGFTWEHPAHLYLRRAKATQLLLGTPRAQRARIAEFIAV
jgi:alkylation response protein AidB-like acyl-CoA dehydrogenase